MAEIEAAVVQPMADVEELLSLVGNMTALTTLEDEARAGFKGCLPQIPRDLLPLDLCLLKTPLYPPTADKQY